MPREDSLFFSDQLKKYFKNKKLNKKIKALDLGAGSGILAETLIELGIKNITASDIDNEAVNFLRKKKIKSIKSDLFEKINGKFDLIVFNPPYLPESKYDKKKDVAGGKRGDETILNFIKQVRNHLTEDGEVILLLSSLTPRKRIMREIKNGNMKIEKLAEEKFFFEKLELFVLKYFDMRISNSSRNNSR